MRRLVDEFGLTHQAAADAVGRSRAAVSNLMRLLDLHPDVLALVDRGELEMGSARALLALPAPQQLEAARTVVHRGLSARETERLVQRLRQQQEGRASSAGRRKDPDVRRLEEDLSERLGTRVELVAGSRGRGKLVIEDTSLDQLDGILAHIRDA